jgi:hypothetical protein
MGTLRQEALRERRHRTHYPSLGRHHLLHQDRDSQPRSLVPHGSFYGRRRNALLRSSRPARSPQAHSRLSSGVTLRRLRSKIQAFANHSRLAGKLLAKHQLVNKLDSTLISRDPEVCKRFDEDPLCHDTGTLEGLAGMLDRTNSLSSGKIVIPDTAGEGGVTRIWIAHGDQDGITSYHASKRLFDNLDVKDKEFKTYAGYYHRRKHTFVPSLNLTNDYSTR